MAAAEIQGFEANAEHYLVVKEGSGDNGRARIRQQGGDDGRQTKKNRFQQKRKGDLTQGYNFSSCGNYVVVISCFFQDFFWRLVKYGHFTWEFCDLVYGIVI